MASSHRPRSVTLALFLIILNAAFWLTFAILAAVGAIRSLTTLGMLRWVMAALGIGASVVLAGMAVLLAKHNRFAFFAGLLILVLVAVFSLADQVGLPDLFTFFISLATLGLMLKERAWFLRESTPAPTQDQTLSSQVHHD